MRALEEFRYTHYANVNKRVRELQNQGYIKEAGIKSTKAGFRATEYELTARAYLALMFSSINLEDWLYKMNEDLALVVLATMMEMS